MRHRHLRTIVNMKKKSGSSKNQVALKEPKAKKRKLGVEIRQPLPVPIASLTGIKANDCLWRYYHGKLQDTKVLIQDPQEANWIHDLGFFGTFGDPRDTRSGKSIKSGASLVHLEEIQLSKSGQEKSEQAPDSSDSEEEIIDLENETSKLLQLSLCEAFFLAFGLGCLIVKNHEDKEMNIDDLWTSFNEKQKEFPFQYAVYHHFRCKGYVVKDGTKFGTDFLLYKDGPAFYHAQYSVRICKNSQPLNWEFVSGLNRVSESAAKELLLAQISDGDYDQIKDLTDLSLREKLNSVQISEMLIRRFVPSQERD